MPAINGFEQDNMICVGPYWTENEAIVKMNEFESALNNQDSWEKRAKPSGRDLLKETPATTPAKWIHGMRQKREGRNCRVISMNSKRTKSVLN